MFLHVINFSYPDISYLLIIEAKLFTINAKSIIAPPTKLDAVICSSSNKYPHIGAKILSTTNKSPTSAGITYFVPIPIRNLDKGVIRSPKRKIGKRAEKLTLRFAPHTLKSTTNIPPMEIYPTRLACV